MAFVASHLTIIRVSSAVFLLAEGKGGKSDTRITQVLSVKSR